MSNTVDIVLVKSSGGDWEGIYVNKKLFIQGHSSHADMLTCCWPICVKSKC